MQHRILLVNPPFTQLNTPYPATAYLKGFLQTKGIHSDQMDLGIDTILQLFSRQGLRSMFDAAASQAAEAAPHIQRIFELREVYIATIEPVIRFLQDDDPTLAYQICQRHFLPEASRFEVIDDLEWAFGMMGIRDQARHMATLYLEDLSDFIRETIDPHFGFSRYAERLGLSAHSFDDLYRELHQPPGLITRLMLRLLENKIRASKPTLICFSIPFPGNLLAALLCGQWVKQHLPHMKVVMGGGYANTELRSLSDPRMFECTDFICLDDGEAPLMTLLSHLEGRIPDSMLKRTFVLNNGSVTYCNGSLMPDVAQAHVGTPDYEGLPLKKYLSVIQITNPMHRLWSDGRWNKLTMAHGCYWGKCTFCDISLDYIKNYESASASMLVDRMETLIRQTGETGFHFVDEAAPPALMKAVALEILRRKLVVSWWTNIRFEKSFHYDLCRLLASSGCIAISGGLEVASDRLLQLIAKGVTVEQVSVVNDNFRKAGIMVHAYLMYGFPTQTAQETIDSLEVVRQMFEQGVLQSAYWHRLAVTAHSPLGMHPDRFNIELVSSGAGAFANNDLEHEDPSGADHDLYGEGLRKSLYNYMHGVCLDHPLQNWFEHPVPETTLPPDLIARYLARPRGREMKDSHQIIWTGGPVKYDATQACLRVMTRLDSFTIPCAPEEGRWIQQQMTSLTPGPHQVSSFKELRESYNQGVQGDFTLFWYGAPMERLKEIGLLVV